MNNVVTSIMERDRIGGRTRRSPFTARPSGSSGVSQAFLVDLESHGHGERVGSDDILKAATALRSSSRVIEHLLRNRMAHAEAVVELFPKSAKARLDLARTSINSGDLTTAQEAVDRARELLPGDDNVSATQGRIFALLGQLDDALDIYVSLLKKSDLPRTRQDVATILLAQGRTDEAIEHLKIALTQSRRGSSIHVNLGVAYLAQEKPQRAIAHFRKAAELEPSHQAYNGLGVAHALSGNAKKAERAFRAALQLEPGEPDATLNLAKILGEQERWSEVAALVSEILNRYPTHWEAKEFLATALFHIGRFREATAHFQGILAAIEKNELAGDRAGASSNVAAGLIRLGQFERAESLLRQSLDISDGKNTLAIENLVRLYMVLGRTDKTWALLDQLFKLMPTARSTRLLAAGQLYLEERYAESLDQCTLVLQENAFDVDAACLATSILTDVYDKYREAEEMLRPVWHRHPAHRAVINNLAYTLVLQGKLQEAESLLDRAEWKPDLHSAILTATRGLLFLRRGDLSGGAQLYNSAASIAGGIAHDLEALIIQKKELELGLFYIRDGRGGLARNHLSRAATAEVAPKIYTSRAQALLREL